MNFDCNNVGYLNLSLVTSSEYRVAIKPKPKFGFGPDGIPPIIFRL